MPRRKGAAPTEDQRTKYAREGYKYLMVHRTDGAVHPGEHRDDAFHTLAEAEAARDKMMVETKIPAPGDLFFRQVRELKRHVHIEAFSDGRWVPVEGSYRSAVWLYKYLD
jgi:hypothetical protein